MASPYAFSLPSILRMEVKRSSQYVLAEEKCFWWVSEKELTSLLAANEPMAGPPIIPL